MTTSIASLWATVLASLTPVEPTRCPYCPDRTDPHWIGWGSYCRYAEGRDQKIKVHRYRCRFSGRTFSLLPDGLLPYHYLRTATILQRLEALFLEQVRASSLARIKGLARTSVRRIRDRFAHVIAQLRLPGQEAALSPAQFLRRLQALGPHRVRELFRGWKELDPKHCIVGFYAR